MVDLAISLYTDILVVCLPVCIVFELCNLLVGTFLRAAFSGKLWLGR